VDETPIKITARQGNGKDHPERASELQDHIDTILRPTIFDSRYSARYNM
jgi:hypothetical protein